MPPYHGLMVRDSQRTRRLLLEAATSEFAQYGLAGARVDRIAATAGVNKERIYQYFGSKDALFGTVLEHHLAAVMDAVPLDGDGPEAIVDYAGRVFDHHDANPTLARLTFWEGLERESHVAEAARRERSERKVDAAQRAHPALGREGAQDLLLTIVTLCTAWPVLHGVDRLFGSPSEDPSRTARRRRAVLAAVQGALRENAELETDRVGPEVGGSAPES